jgi:aminoglycoside phosphotransferase family enzyme
MTYSQAPLLGLFRSGEVPGESETPEHIETVISNVFLFKDRVYKIYKNDNDFFNNNFHDISSREERFAFSISDFDWNNQLTKEVFLRLQGVKILDNAMVLLDEYNGADELVLVTKRLPTGTVLFDLLQAGSLAEGDFYEIGKQFAQREKGFILSGAVNDELLSNNMTERYYDVLEWIKDTKEVSDSEKEGYAGQLKELINRVYANDTSKVSVCFDFHSLNAFYVDKILYPFDTHPPKDAWRFGPPLLNIYRLATDVFAFAGEKEFRAVMNGYCEYLNISSPDEEVERLLVIYAALIMVSYLFMLVSTDGDKRDAALKYHDFLKRYSSS